MGLFVYLFAYCLSVICVYGNPYTLLLDFNKITDVPSEFNTCPYFKLFTIKSYTDTPLEPFRSDSQTYLSISEYNMWTCLSTKTRFTLNENAKLKLAINLISASNDSVVYVNIGDLDSAYEALVLETGPTNGWKELSNTFEKPLLNAKLYVQVYIPPSSSLAIEYVQITNGETTEAPTEP
ncbi:hypothetical protein Bhyg_10537 [Pseudolycoriella hygida]|uniref:Uncharacterized protein n=1 Tax=Pseudolycoriella hygida TaxID=35572 RepID=A0A9Q0MTQ3_9DIPT|nr:hypothetical protein Bhyg_10537 [Pseudolycoriella hygida]